MNSNITKAWVRKKAIALLLAWLFGPWTWVYTYSRDPAKAALGLGSNISLLTFWLTLTLSLRKVPDSPGSYPGEAIIYTAIPTFTIVFVTWLVAVISTSTAKNWQTSGPQNREKMPALMLAMFLGPWTWLYTHRIDYWKFWPSLLIVFGVFLLNTVVGSPIFHALWVLGGVAIWITAIVSAASRNDKWYKSYGELKVR